MKTFYQVKNIDGAITDVDTSKRTVSGYFSRFNNVDSDNDLIKPGAFMKSIHETGPDGSDRIKHLKNHNPSQMIGKLTTLNEDGSGLFFTSVLSTNSHGKDALIEYQEKMLTEHSIGFITLQSDDSKEDYNIINEINLWEGSAVTWGANELTPVTSIKAYKDMDDEQLVKEFEYVKKLCSLGGLSDEYLASVEIKMNQLMQIIAEKLESKPVEKTTKMPDNSEVIDYLRNGILENG